jgi:hypothetical protein
MKRLKANHPRSYSRLWQRPTRFVAISLGAAAAVIGIVLQRNGTSGVYVETAFTAVLLLWVLLAAFRPEWRRSRYWLAMAVIMGSHVALWLSLERRTGHLGFVPMFALLVVEIIIAAALVFKAMPDDAEVTRDYIRRW